jgi:hypothetical protein
MPVPKEQDHAQFINGTDRPNLVKSGDYVPPMTYFFARLQRMSQLRRNEPPARGLCSSGR